MTQEKDKKRSRKYITVGLKLTLGVGIIANLCMGFLIYTNWRSNRQIDVQNAQLMSIKDDLSMQLRFRIFDLQKKYLSIAKYFETNPTPELLDWIEANYDVVDRRHFSGRDQYRDLYDRVAKRDLSLGRFVIQNHHDSIVVSHGLIDEVGNFTGEVGRIQLRAPYLEDDLTRIRQVVQQAYAREPGERELQAKLSGLKAVLADEALQAEEERNLILYRFEEIFDREQHLERLKDQLSRQTIAIVIISVLINMFFLFVLTRRIVEKPLDNLSAVIDEIREGGTPEIPYLERSDQIGELSGTLKNFNDAVIDLKASKAQLVQSQKMESIGTLAGGIAHDFNNILSSILGFTELALIDNNMDTRLKGYLDEIYKAGLRARDLVKQILTFARQSDAEVKPIRVDIIVKEVVKFMRSSIPTTIEIVHAVESDRHIIGNATQVHQIIMNLCTNAAQAMENNGGVLSVGLKDITLGETDQRLLQLNTAGHYLELSVGDTGIGIPPDVIDSIFEPYFTTKEKGKGTGMGLAMVNGIVESYGGKIRVQSTVAKGTLFRVYFPATQKQSSGTVYEQEDLPTGSEHILVVDDEAAIVTMSRGILVSLGYTVSTRTSSVEALKLFRAKPTTFDLVITDLTMPNLTGEQLAIELLKMRVDIPIILCTGYSNKITEETATRMGFKAVLLKPLIKGQLAKAIRKVLDG